MSFRGEIPSERCYSSWKSRRKNAPKPLLLMKCGDAATNMVFAYDGKNGFDTDSDYLLTEDREDTLAHFNVPLRSVAAAIDHAERRTGELPW